MKALSGKNLIRTLTNKSALLSMNSSYVAVVFLVLMVIVIVTADVLFFRTHFWERLAVNIGIVLVFVAFYFRFLK